MRSFSDKRILIAGAGAIGSFYGGLLAKAGFDVDLLARGAHLRAMQQTGSLHITSWKYGENEINVNAVEAPEGLYDIIILCVKSHDTANTCVQIKDFLKANGCIVSFQNGVENPDVISQFFKRDQVIAASVFTGLWISPPGRVQHASSGSASAGAWHEDAKKHEPVLKAVFDHAGLPFSISTDIKHTLWGKLVWNVAFNPLSALLESTCGPMMRDGSAALLMEKMVIETVEAAKLHGVTITEEEWREKIEYKKVLEHYKTSMLQDIERLRTPEVDGILGPVVRTHEKHGGSAPYCETVMRSLEFKYGGHYIYCPKLTVDMIVRKEDSILLIERKNEPFGWALPGGFVDYGETVEHAAVRELKEETGINAGEITMLGVYSDPARDKRGHTASVVYHTTSDQTPKAGDDAKNAQFFRISSLPEDIVFDHRKIISDYLLKV